MTKIKYLLFILVFIFYFIFVSASKHKGILAEGGIDTSLNSYLPVLVLIIGCFFIYMFISRTNQLRILQANLSIIKELLHGQIKRPFFGLWFYQSIDGMYKNRKISFVICFFAEEYDIRWWWVKTRGENNYFKTLIDNPQVNRISLFAKRITPNIYLKGNSLYSKSDFTRMIVYQPVSVDQGMACLNEFVDKADQFEKGLLKS